MRYILYFLISIFILTTCQTKNESGIATQKMNIEMLANDITILAADSMEGRAPCTAGEVRTINYLKRRMKEIGLEPAFNNNYFQEVPLVKISSNTPNSIVINDEQRSLNFENGTGISLWSPVLTPEISLTNNEIIFLGFGIDAPENNWNDFNDIDVTGKTIMVFVNDPGFYTEDSTLFNGKSMTYYGRWTYKFEEAERKGAAGCIIIHEDEAAGYPWAVPASHATNPEYYLNDASLREMNCKIRGWISQSSARELLFRSGFDYDSLKTAATNRDFTPVSLNAKLNVTIHNSWKECTSHNVAGVLEGKAAPDEAIVYVAHWDHLGIGQTVNGDSIYNGASDNAAAMAWLLAIAEEFKAHPQTDRSVLFFIPTAEEAGLLGTYHYVQNPVFPMEKTVAGFNSDVILLLGKFSDVTVTGLRHSELDEYLKTEANKQNRYIANDPNPENGMFFRSDQLPFLKQGVPFLFAKGYTHQRELGKEATLQQIIHYWKNVYHKPSDEFVPERDKLDGLFEDAQLFFSIGYRIANENTYPQWYRTSEFYRER
ncbi:MAG: M28 family peptidase [Bacteroidia bacterium]|nr:M28 family peptidase [Bacteroidia bacterium]